MGSKKESTRAKHLKVIEVYNHVVKDAGKYAPYLSKSYYVENTIHECKNQGITEVSRTLVYAALKDCKKLESEKNFLNVVCER